MLKYFPVFSLCPKSIKKIARIQFMSQQAAVDLKTVITDKTSTEEKKENTIGKYYHALVFRGRKGNALALGDLRHLLQMCTAPDHLVYAIQGVQLFQRKGQDFSEEVCSHFIKACIRTENSRAAVEIINKYNYRIGAWLTQTSLLNLLQSISATEDTKVLVHTVEIAAIKGLRVSVPIVELILKVCTEKCDLECYNRMMVVARTSLELDSISSISSSFPPPASPALETTTVENDQNA